jgi:CheY-like chemotaxis protein
MREAKDIRILVVEDEALLRMAVVFDFKRRGFQVFEAVNGREAYDLLIQTPVDIVLTDVRMPGGDGIELLERIKARDPATPIVMLMTGFADLSLEDALNKGADTVFPKPFDRKALVAIMQEVIQPQKQEWSQRQYQRVATDFEVDIQYGNSPVLVKGRVLNLSRGGMFVVPSGEPAAALPETGTKLSFALHSNVKTPHTLESQGTVRHVSAGQESQSGFGIDFEEMPEATRSQLLHLINDVKTTNFFSSRMPAKSGTPKS